MFTPETARSVMYPILLTLGGSALLASIAFFAKKYFIGRQWEVDAGGGAGGRQVRPWKYAFEKFPDKDRKV